MKRGAIPSGRAVKLGRDLQPGDTFLRSGKVCLVTNGAGSVMLEPPYSTIVVSANTEYELIDIYMTDQNMRHRVDQWTLDFYQKTSAQFLRGKDRVWNDLTRRTTAYTGLAAEAGEVCALLQKSVRDDREIRSKDLLEECGDVLWYLAEVHWSTRCLMF